MILLFRDLETSENGGAEVGTVGDFAGDIHFRIHCLGVGNSSGELERTALNPRQGCQERNSEQRRGCEGFGFGFISAGRHGSDPDLIN